jgi:hypothetical protein
VNEVGRLLRALAEENGEDGAGPAAAAAVSNRSSHGGLEGLDHDSDLTSKSTGSTKGSPDWSLGGAAVPDLSLAHAQRRGGGGGILVTKPRTNPSSASNRGVIFAQHLPQSRGKHGMMHPSPAPNAAAGASSSSSLSKSPLLSRLLFRRAQNNLEGVPELERERGSATVGTLQRSTSKASRVVSSQSTAAGRIRKPTQQRSGAAAPSARIPVGKRRSRSHLDRDFGNDDEDNEEASELQLQQLYDLRTWDLYMRITEARQLREQQKQQQQQWHHIPHAQPHVEPEVDPYHHHNDASTEPTSSPDSDYGWYDDYPSSRSQPGRSPTSARAAMLPPNGTAADNSHELIFGDPEL